ncbi:hypothetical protein [Vibrio parahaemolyticus]|uniref:hypothetical protein n=1 Tax=Vibrio parahaemolyticus TaxID=670 RepID=UPI00215D2633|nr:hypothetical protein [Vibrio parahaemolyticus]MCR9663877.1 hypothetical protein [Vibrio parahaemolyticus]MCR9679351.1 hypothetical protein [Vibrio parahaemolyticus]
MPKNLNYDQEVILIPHLVEKLEELNVSFVMSRDISEKGRINHEIDQLYKLLLCVRNDIEAENRKSRLSTPYDQ